MEQQPDLGDAAPVLLETADTDAADQRAPSTSLGFRMRRALRHKSLLVGLVIVAAIVIMILAAPLMTSYSPSAQDGNAVFARPSLDHHLMGTDAFGRDVFARVLYGGRKTVLASIAVAVIGCTIGSLLGLIAGFFGGLPGFLIMRVVDLLLAFPGILFALIVAAILGPGLVNGIVAVAVVSVPAYARVVEGAALEVRDLPYVDAAVTLGSSSRHILTRHIFPNVLPGIIVMATSWLGIAALWIAALGFLGLGVQPPTPEWGAIVNDGQNYITLAWWIALFPGTMLALFVVAVNLIGDGLRDELDPTLARR